MDSEIAATSVTASATLGAAAAAAEAVAVALAAAKTGNCNDGAVLGTNETAGLISDGRGKETIPLNDSWMNMKWIYKLQCLLFKSRSDIEAGFSAQEASRQQPIDRGRTERR